MKYFHRTSLAADRVLEGAGRFLGSSLAQVEQQPRHRQFAGAIGRIGVTVQAEGGHYTLVTIATDQVGESEADKLSKRFLTMVHTMAEPTHRAIGAY